MSGHEGGCSRLVRRALTVHLGLSHPHIELGSIVVNGIAAAAHTDILPASLSAHAAVTAPFRWLSQNTVKCQPGPEL